jgi:hypothetical protein
LATQNLLLKLLAYYGTGCTFTPSTENPPEASKVVPIQDYSMALSHSQYKVIWKYVDYWVRLLWQPVLLP